MIKFGVHKQILDFEDSNSVHSGLKGKYRSPPWQRTSRITHEDKLGFGWFVLPDPRYSPGLEPTDYYRSWSLKTALMVVVLSLMKTRLKCSGKTFATSKPAEFYLKRHRRAVWQVVTCPCKQWQIHNWIKM